MSLASRFARAAIRCAVGTVILTGCPTLAQSNDPFRQPVCLGFHTDSADEATDARTTVKVVRWPYALEQPFHVLPDDQVDGNDATDPAVRIVYQGHGGLVMEGPLEIPWNAAFELTAAFPRGPDPRRPLCGAGEEVRVLASRLVSDPSTGNVFVGQLHDRVLQLTVIDPDGGTLAQLRSNIYFDEPFRDASGSPLDELAAQAGDYFWFDLDRLAGFVDAYRRIGEASYARYLVDAFLAETAHAGRTAGGTKAAPRLPFLPLRDAGAWLPPSDGIDNLRGLRTTYRQVFVSEKPRKGGVSCALMPVLKMVEDRDCRGSVAVARDSGPCPAYSAMALQTELFRSLPETMRDRRYAFYEVFERLVARGVCAEGYYPMLTDIAIGRTRSLEALGKRSERELNRIVSSDATEANEEFREFRELMRGQKLTFVEQLPPLCAQAMQAYRERSPLEPHDLVDLFTVQRQFEGALPEALTNRLAAAQKEELFLLLARLLRQGLLVGVSGDSGRLEGHAELAYGWNDEGFLLMDSDASAEATRRRTVIPTDELRRTIAGTAFLRGEVPAVDPTESQLVRTVAIAPEMNWIHQRLGRICAADGRNREAATHLRRAADGDPDNAEVLLEFAESLQAVGRFEEALRQTESAIARGADERGASGLLGYSLRKLGRLEEAESALRAALSADHSWEWRQLGWTLFDLGRDDEAEHCFRRALEIDSRRVWNHVSLAELLAYRGKTSDARGQLIAASELEFNSDGKAWIAGTLAWIGHDADAVPLLRAVLRQEPEHGPSRLALARIYRRSGRAEELATVLQPLERRLSSRVADAAVDDAALIELAYVHALGGQRNACRRISTRLAERRESLEGAELYEMACIHALNDDPELALDYLSAAFDNGFDDYRWARHDPDLAGLAAEPRLEQIFDRHGSHER
jgi:tetratricopeptide (TPR) repeat protein